MKIDHSKLKSVPVWEATLSVTELKSEKDSLMKQLQKLEKESHWNREESYQQAMYIKRQKIISELTLISNELDKRVK